MMLLGNLIIDFLDELSGSSVCGIFIRRAMEELMHALEVATTIK